MRSVFLTCCFLLLSGVLWGQPPTALFSVNSTPCLNETLKPDNQSSNATRYEWDYCQGDLATTPDGTSPKTIGGRATTGIDVVFDGTNWYGFVASQQTNSLMRLDFGTDIYSTPTVVDLGNVSSQLNNPIDVKVVNENGNWYGFVYSLSDPMISRINFGNSLTNTTSSTIPITADPIVSGTGSNNSGFDMMYDGSNWIIVFTNYFSFSVVRMPSITGVPASGDIISGIQDPSMFLICDVVLTKSAGNYYGYVACNGNSSLQRLSFGTNLFSTPAVTDIPLSILSTLTPCGSDMGYDNGKYYWFITAQDGKTIRVNLGSDLSTINATADVITSPFENLVKLKLVKHKTSWLAFEPSWVSTNLYRLAFQNPQCNTIAEGSAPVHTFSTSGTNAITLRAFNSSGVFGEDTHVVNVSSTVAPQVDFAITGICATSPSQFTATSPDNVTAYDWDFGDATTGGGQNTSHQFATGTYDVTLQATGTNGCTNAVFKNTKVYDQPVPDFTTPAGLVCTNNNFIFSNQTPDNFDGNLSYQWSVGADVVGTNRDLQYAFTAVGDNDVKLKVSIPGCFDELTKVVSNVQTGPAIGFMFTGKCESESFIFTNTSSGDISGYSWTFGDGNTSTAVNPSHVYPSKGSYVVTLNTTANNGCVSALSQPLNVYSLPATSFSLDLPPFSCSGTPSQFHDTTPSMTDSNVQSWNWTFGDSGSGTGKNPLHTYTAAGAYTARLSVTTDRGCSNFIDQQVNISQSPNVNFNSDVACVNKATHFTDVSGGNLVAWQWKVGSALYNTQNPTHTFPSPGNYNVQLVVTAPNNCTASLTRQVTVPVVPTLDFQVINACSDQAAVFTDITTNAADPITTHSWSFNGIGTGTGQQASYTFASSGTYPVQLSVQALSGCSYSATKQVTIHASPLAAFTMSDQSGPPPLHVMFTNKSTGASSYAWSFGDGSSPSTAVSLEHAFASLGDYNVSLVATSADGCSKSITKVVSVIIPVVELAIEDFLVKQSVGKSYQGYVQVRNNGNYRVTSFTVNYEIGGGIVLTETVASDLSIGETKTYTLATAFNQPSQSSFVCIELNDDTNDSNNKACATLSGDAVVFDVSPNPADSYINVESIQPSSGQVRVRMYNMQGGVAYDKTFNVGKGLSRISPDLQDLSPGIYVAVITSGEATSSTRLLILH